jgi:phage repressor protein C with HTH and peptisase S24 domain
MTLATFATKSQALNCDNRFCAPVAIVAKGGVDIEILKARLEARGIRQVDLAEALGIEPDKVSKVFAGKRRWRGEEALKLARLLADHDNSTEHPDIPPAGREPAYVNIAVLPSFAGMGGGGNGVGEQAVAKLPRDLIEDQLHGRAGDFELIDVRGDSMEPDFCHGDQILIDRRDRDPRQPGPFALWDEDGYVVKLVERVPNRRGWYRVFSANPRYSSYEIEETEATIRGRPVWFARRL